MSRVVGMVDWPIFGVGIFVGWSVLIVANDLLGFATLGARARSRFATVFLILSIGGALGFGFLAHARPAAPCPPHAKAR
jgi:hypothetical protein